VNAPGFFPSGAPLMKVLLVWPNSRNELLGWGDLGAIAEPLALEYLAAGAKNAGHQVEILDLRIHGPAALQECLQRFRPDVVGVSAFSMHVRRAKEICDESKRHDPLVRTVVGGHHATLLPEDFFCSSVDYVVCGEGVGPFVELLGRWTSDKPVVNDVLGVWQRTENGFSFAGAQDTRPIDELPFPDRAAVASDRSSYFIDWMRPVALLRTTVGCPYRCEFCSLWQIEGGKYRVRQIDRVVAELGEIEEPNVFLVDDEAFIRGKRMIDLAHAIGAAGIKKAYFAYARVDSIVRNRVALGIWREIGLRRLFVGIDSFSEEGLEAFNKSYKVAEIEAALDVARDLGIDIFAQFVVDPLYTENDFRQLERFIEHHRINYPSFTVLTPIPGTPLLERSTILFQQPDGRPDWDLFDCQNAVTPTTLKEDEFRARYRRLFHTFKGSYVQYREHNSIIHDTSLAASTRRSTVDRGSQWN
jgi:radical SAM superfamily enzyme YgiQ (UPF0313 family)